MARLSPRLAVPLIALALVAVGCGGSKVAVKEVPGGPVELKVPGSGGGFAAAATPTSTAAPDATETPAAGAEATAAPETSGGATDPAGEPGAADGGVEAPADEEGAGGEQAPPAAGAGADEVADYCADNPGAC